MSEAEDQNERMMRDVLSGQASEPGDEEIVSEEGTIGEPFAEPKRGVNQNTLVMIVMLAVVIGITYLMVLRSTPQGASGAVGAGVDPTGQAIDTFLSGGGNDLHSIATMIQNTQTLVTRFRQDPALFQVPLDDLKTNPFQISRDVTPTTKPAEEVDEEAAKAAKEAQKARDAVIAAAGQMHLQSVAIGQRGKTCVIDEKLYMEGDMVGTFKLVEIRPGSVVVSKSGLKLEIPLPSGGGR